MTSFLFATTDLTRIGEPALPYHLSPSKRPWRRAIGAPGPARASALRQARRRLPNNGGGGPDRPRKNHHQDNNNTSIRLIKSRGIKATRAQAPVQGVRLRGRRCVRILKSPG